MATKHILHYNLLDNVFYTLQNGISEFSRPSPPWEHASRKTVTLHNRCVMSDLARDPWSGDSHSLSYWR